MPLPLPAPMYCQIWYFDATAQDKVEKECAVFYFSVAFFFFQLMYRGRGRAYHFSFIHTHLLSIPFQPSFHHHTRHAYIHIHTSYYCTGSAEHGRMLPLDAVSMSSSSSGHKNDLVKCRVLPVLYQDSPRQCWCP
ncbi:unnamed protein product [Mortierella alpina]